MKTKFWIKTYVITLILFLTFLNASVFLLGLYSYRKNADAHENICKSEHSYIVKAFTHDLTQLKESDADANNSLLMQSYCLYYKKQGIDLAFFNKDTMIYSSLTDNSMFSDISLAEENIFQKRIGKVRYLCIVSVVQDTEYSLVYAKDISGLDAEWLNMAIAYMATAIVISLILAVILFLLLKKLSTPLEKLKQITNSIADGDYSVVADESGSDEFSLLAKSFNEMTVKINSQISELELTASQKQQLVDNLAHELRTPLTSIQGYAEYIQRAAISEPEKIDAAEYIISEANRLSQISERLLDIAFLKNNEITAERVSLKNVLQDVISSLKFKADSKDVCVDTEIKDAEISGDEILLYIVFANLVDNAIKASAKGGHIHISLSAGDESIVVSVKDEGSGMKEEEMLHITEPFYRADKSRSREYGGVGLGLTLCKQIVNVHGAELTFSSKAGFGTTATVTFASKILN